jgi:hypothetical protein
MNTVVVLLTAGRFTLPLSKGMTHVNGVFETIYCEACQAQVNLSNIQQPVFPWHPARSPLQDSPRWGGNPIAEFVRKGLGFLGQ